MQIEFLEDYKASFGNFGEGDRITVLAEYENEAKAICQAGLAKDTAGNIQTGERSTTPVMIEVSSATQTQTVTEG